MIWRRGLSLAGKGEVDVGPVEAVQEPFGRGAVEQLFDDLVLRFGIRRRGERGQRHVQRAAQFADAQVIGAKIMAPLADAMRLVHGDQRDVDAPQHAHRRAGGEAFGRDIEQFERPCLQRLPDGGGLFLGIAGGQRARLDARGLAGRGPDRASAQ